MQKLTNYLLLLSVLLFYSNTNAQEAAAQLKDSRDGEEYKTVKIGKHTWMAENLRFETEGSYQNPDHSEYGRHYTWEAATKVCPAGWHLPTEYEWLELNRQIGGKETGGDKLKSKEGWDMNGNGSDAYGFAALPGGVYDEGFKRFEQGGMIGYYWMKSKADNGEFQYTMIACTMKTVNIRRCGKGSARNVRCVMDN